MARGPVLFETAGDSFTGNVLINGVIWHYPSSTAGEQAFIHLFDQTLVWKGLADSTNTYLGGFGMKVHSNGGFRCTRLDGGQLLVYLEEVF